MPTIEERAREMLNDASIDMNHPSRWGLAIRVTSPSLEALCRALEARDATLAEFEAFKREVSDAVRQYERELDGGAGDFTKLRRFILPAPVDPLVEAVKDCGYATLDAIEKEFADDLRAALAKRGLKLVEVGDEN